MKYYKITCTNGYCGCDENFYIQAESDSEAWDEANEICSSEYSFAYPDERFVEDMDNWDEIEIYEMNVEAYVEEISKEEYLKAKEWGY